MALTIATTRTIKADWLRDGSFAHSSGGTDYADLRRYIDGPITIRRGIGKDGTPQISSVTISLQNDSGVFTRHNSSSALYGLLKKDIPIKIEITDPADATSYSMFVGVIRRYAWQGFAGHPDKDKNRCVITCESKFARVFKARPQTAVAVSTSRQVDDAISAMAQAAGLVSGDLTLGTSVQDLAYHWSDPSRPAGEQIAAAARCELASYPNLWEAKDGDLTFKIRSALLHGTADYTIGDAGLPFEDITMEDAAEDVFTSLRAKFSVFQPGDAGTILWRHPQGATIAGVNEVQTLTFGGSANTNGQTFTLELEPSGIVSAPIEWQDDNAMLIQNIQTALNAIVAQAAGPDGGAVAVTEGSLTAGMGTVLVEFGGGVFAESEIDTMTVTEALTGTLACAETTAHVRGSVHTGTSDSIALASKAAITLRCPYTQKMASSVTTPVSGTDYIANDANDQTGTDRTSSITSTFTDYGSEAEWTLYNDHSGTVYLTLLQIRGTPVVISRSPIVIKEQSRATPNTDWFTNPGGAVGSVTTEVFAPEVSYTFALPDDPEIVERVVDLPYLDAASSAVMQKYCAGLVNISRQQPERVRVTFVGHTDAIQTFCIKVELGMLLALDDTDAGRWGSNLNDWYRVEAIEHQIPPPGKGLLRTTLTLRPSWAYFDPATSIFDNFDRPNNGSSLGTTPTGDAWTNAGDGFKVLDGKARPIADASIAWSTFDLGAANFVAVAAIENLTSDSNEQAGFTFRFADTSNLWFAFWNDALDEFYLSKIVAGTPTNLATVSYTPRSDGKMEIMVIAQGDRLRVRVDGKQIIDESDSDLNTNTKLGFFTDATTTVDFDRVWLAKC